MSILEENIVLRINRNWAPIGYCTVKDALIAMNSGNEFLKAAKAVDVQYNIKKDGEYDFSAPANLIPCDFLEWTKVEIRPFDNIIRTPRLILRCPSVIITLNYNKIPQKLKRATKPNIFERDGYTCQYSGQKLPKSRLNIDHVVPRDKGGKDTWENQVTCDKEINSKKGNKLNSEVGLQLIKQPRAPLPIPVSQLINEIRHKDWAWFLFK